MNKYIAEKFNLWRQKATGDVDLVNELKKVQKSIEVATENDDIETLRKIAFDLEERFSGDLEFGTGGLRGVIGAGTNRMNHYTVAAATQGLANFVKDQNAASPSVAIAYDSRNKSSYFAKVAARVLAANGIQSYIYSELMPTPMLSYAVRRLKCDAGIVVTASHNPAEYNGYKAYGRDGCQLSLEDSEAVLTQIRGIEDIFAIDMSDFDDAYDKGVIKWVDKEVIEDYFEEVKKQAVHKGICHGAGLRVVYTPLNGAGNIPVRRILWETGVTDVVVVPQQEQPDGNFPTCPYPNPEFKEALRLGLSLCTRERPDLLIATDPDCDRVAIAVHDTVTGGYELFTGNEVGALLLDYICRERGELGTLPLKPIAIKTIVTTTIADKIAQRYGVEVVDTLTGFKFIGEIIGKLEKAGEDSRFIFGFEESIGYLPGSYARDKDAVSTSMLICEMAAFYKKRGGSLAEARRQLYRDYGYYYHYTQNVEFKGQYGKSKMEAIMKKLRSYAPTQILGIDVVTFTDYWKRSALDVKKGTKKDTKLPKSDVISFVLKDGSSVMVRPSGTEPKLKVYYTGVGETYESAVKLQQELMREISAIINV